MKKAFEVLRELEVMIPPPPNVHHSLTVAEYGSESTGWRAVNRLTIFSGSKFREYLLDEWDMDKTVAELVSEIVHLEWEHWTKENNESLS